MFGSMLALITTIRASKSIKKVHTYNFTFFVAIAEIIILTLFGHTQNPNLLPVFFVIHFVLQVLLNICLNVFIETFSTHAKIGTIRGLFLAIFNLGILVAPVIGGFILKTTSFATLYTVAACMLIPYLFFLHKYLNHIHEPAYHEIHILQALKHALKNKNISGALIGELMVQCFYAVMVIYSPIYLATLGVPLTSYMTIILPIALIPLVLLPYELGYLADRKFGEKEMLIIGLLILAVSAFLCVITTSANPFIWAAILFISRIGASFVETMSFSYYFKKVDPEDPSLTALFINTNGVAILIVGLIGGVIAPFLSTRPQLMFIILGCAILWSISIVLKIKDTR
jgi:MFS family permease